ncbi:S-adenosyl-L-methionine-dependent methyltransferase [Mycena albidolilacea]|uniref:S-adenosyl-L-methionine-dependent methyltransferase n=1 Tax=Mycena albidolilacea TaxID=1033008 RepID=A0AAD6ZDM8_9AGAR|nr:S-adenosyl-L-methionine-dependent methyltransferase [Mycena albidolilacea]
MATFAKSSYDSGSYAASRPTYPRLLYDVVMRFHSEGQHNEGSDRWHRAVDLGCGTGQATIELLANDRPGFQSVIALDPSSNMVQVAQESIPEPFKSLVEFRQSTAEDLSFIQDGTVDMVTAAQSAHWFDWNQVWPELQRILKPGGTFAFWGYSGLRLAQHPELTPLITAYSQGTDPATSLGPHWEPKRKILDNHFLDIAAPARGWADLTRVFYTGAHYPALPAPHEDVILRKRMTWGGGLANYLSTYSSLHRYHDRFPADRERVDGDIATRFRRTLMEAVGTTEETAMVEVEWPLALVVVRKVY